MITAAHKPVRPYKRKIHIGKEIYTYRIGGGRCIQIRSPDNKITFTLDSFELNDITVEEWSDWDDLDQYHPYPSITPRQIKDFILNNCR